MATKRQASGRSKSGCLTCRAKRVKCDEGVPSCRRCERLKLLCEQPASRIIPSVGDRRRGAGPLKSRNAETWSPKPILPVSIASPTTTILGGTDEEHMRIGFCDDLDATWSGSYSGSEVQDSSSLTISQLFEQGSLLSVDSEWLLPYPQDLNIHFNRDPEPNCLTPLASSLTLIDGLTLTESERVALIYFRTHFSLSQTTRDPQWSTPTLLLEHASKHSKMLFHLILAVSVYDLQSKGELRFSTDMTAEMHYEIGAQSLAEALQDKEYDDHIGVLGSLYCVYAYMSRQKFVSSTKIDRLSSTAVEYIREKGLDAAYMTPKASCATQSPTINAQRAKDSLIARIIMWIFKIDAQCCFLGCKASILDYFYTRQNLFEAIQSSSRLALQLNWGSNYPISQSIRGIESSMSIDMMADLLAMSYKIERSHNLTFSDGLPRQSDVRKDLDALEVKYGSVFYYGSSEMTLQPAMKLNCATSATLFYATKLYFLRRDPAQFGTEDSPNAGQALGQLLFYAKHVCVNTTPQPVYEFQWSLFIACLETNDMIHQEWLASKICDARFGVAVPKVFAAKRTSGGAISLSGVRQILQGPC